MNPMYVKTNEPLNQTDSVKQPKPAPAHKPAPLPAWARGPQHAPHAEPGADESGGRREDELQIAAPRREGSVLGAIAGGVIGGIGGAVIGGLTAGPVGAVVGGVLGAGVGAAIGSQVGKKDKDKDKPKDKPTVSFPTWAQVVTDGDVQTKINAAWASTKAATSRAGRREEGFWIRKNVKSGKFEFTGTVTGPVVGADAGASVEIGSRPADNSPGTDDAVYTVASFHTHTPTTYRTVGRGVGPSDADHRVDTSDDVTGVVYDYEESPAGSGSIPAAHPIDSTAKVYHSGPVSRQRE